MRDKYPYLAVNTDLRISGGPPRTFDLLIFVKQKICLSALGASVLVWKIRGGWVPSLLASRPFLICVRQQASNIQEPSLLTSRVRSIRTLQCYFFWAFFVLFSRYEEFVKWLLPFRETLAWSLLISYILIFFFFWNAIYPFTPPPPHPTQQCLVNLVFFVTSSDFTSHFYHVHCTLEVLRG